MIVIVREWRDKEREQNCIPHMSYVQEKDTKTGKQWIRGIERFRDLSIPLQLLDIPHGVGSMFNEGKIFRGS